MSKTGYWMKERPQSKGCKYKCSECGELAYYIGGTRAHEPTKCLYPFCPYCKAKMNTERGD